MENTNYLDHQIYNLGAFVLPLFTNAVVLCLALAGYNRTKKRVFGIWIAATILGFVDVLTLFMLRDSKYSTDQHCLWLFWSLESIVAGLLGTYGIILLMRQALSRNTP